MIKDKCALPSCENELIHKEGRKKKKYCCTNHSVRHWQMLNPKKAQKTKQIPMDKWKEIEKKLNMDVDDNRDNPLINAARGRDRSGINEDELKTRQNKPKGTSKPKNKGKGSQEGKSAQISKKNGFSGDNSGLSEQELRGLAAKNTNRGSKYTPTLKVIDVDFAGKHPLWKEGDPKEGSMAFFNKYGVESYNELQKIKK